MISWSFRTGMSTIYPVRANNRISPNVFLDFVYRPVF
jgi:hypothetical protein